MRAAARVPSVLPPPSIPHPLPGPGRRRGMEAAHSLPVLDVLRRFGVTESCGLSPEQVRRNREKYGPNG